ncbi:hypothetical protein ACFVGN_05960 [Streptomyces sp. NPDC057757]|uniref:hypothetical protein n=1 Tax=Streptomyces sp. NPDC057757 TaxID=3346241 RepID=UPI0036B5352A
MEVHIEATLDERSAGSRGDAFARWFRAAVDSFFPDPSAFTDSSILVDELFEGGGEELRTKGVWDNWPALEESLRRYPFWSDLTFHSPVDHEYDTIDVVGRVNGTYLRSDGSYAALSVGTAAGERIGDPEFCTRIVDFLAEALDGTDPAFVRVEYLNFSDTTDLEAGLRRARRKSLRESRSYLRGYAWVTGVPSELVARLGGREGLAATGAFYRVEELSSGGLLLQATETLAGYSDHAMRGIFTALAPVLPPGIPHEDPAHPEMRLVLEDASGV